MVTYKEAGVDIFAGEEAVRRIKTVVRSTFTGGVLTDIGTFGAFFQPDWQNFDEPVLVSSVDGVGTKLLIAVAAGRFDTVGHDLVNHCVNDIAVCGARPLFFLDYFAAGKLDPDIAEDIVKGFAAGCLENGCALIGGEMAEMPDIYSEEDIDLAGTIVGIVDKARIIDGSSVRSGDAILGVPSNGLHTNGYTLARKVLLGSFDMNARPDELEGRTIEEEMLRVHRSYLEVISALSDADLSGGFAHITGGGIEGNTKRVLRDGLELDVDWSAWERPGVFRLIQSVGDVPEEDMRRTFNLGIGLVAIVPQEAAGDALKLVETLGHSVVDLGRVR